MYDKIFVILFSKIYTFWPKTIGFQKVDDFEMKWGALFQDDTPSPFASGSLAQDDLAGART